MPIYEYECEQCAKIHEVSQSIKDEPLQNCPKCGSPVKKLISLSSFAFKGTGFYTTDYKRAGTSGKEAQPEKALPKTASESPPTALAPGESKKAESTKSALPQP